MKRNSKNNLGHCNFKQREMEGLNPKQVVQKLKEKGVIWDDMPGNPQLFFASELIVQNPTNGAYSLKKLK